jgi:hypothetical protein
MRPFPEAGSAGLACRLAQGPESPGPGAQRLGRATRLHPRAQHPAGRARQLPALAAYARGFPREQGRSDVVGVLTLSLRTRMVVQAWACNNHVAARHGLPTLSSVLMTRSCRFSSSPWSDTCAGEKTEGEPGQLRVQGHRGRTGSATSARPQRENRVSYECKATEGEPGQLRVQGHRGRTGSQHFSTTHGTMGHLRRRGSRSHVRSQSPGTKGTGCGGRAGSEHAAAARHPVLWRGQGFAGLLSQDIAECTCMFHSAPCTRP